MQKKKLAKFIDYTKLKPETTESDIDTLLKEALEYDVSSVCVNPSWVKRASAYLKLSSVKVCTVIGFPLGANTTAVKVFETKIAVKEGAHEIDMVINIGAIKSKNWNLVEKDISEVVKAAHSKGSIVKVILENCLLTKEEIKKACEVCLRAKADFVKTSTGFSTGGALVEDLRLMKSVVGSKIEIKASGGVKTYEQALAVIDAGANRIGTSTIDFLKEQSKETPALPNCCSCVARKTLLGKLCQCSCHNAY